MHAAACASAARGCRSLPGPIDSVRAACRTVDRKPADFRDAPDGRESDACAPAAAEAPSTTTRYFSTGSALTRGIRSATPGRPDGPRWTSAAADQEYLHSD